MQVTHQAVQKVVSRLRAKGLLEAVVSARDGREHEVSVTREGGRLAHELAGHGEDAGRGASDGPDRRDDLLAGSEESR